MKKANIEQIVVVSNVEDSYLLLTEIQDSNLVVNKNPDSGRTSSIKLGIETVMRDKGRIPDKIVLVPVDRPGWNFEHIAILLNQNVSSCISCLGRKGHHPVLIVKDNLPDIMVSKNDKPLNEIVQFVPVDVDGAIIDLNIDTAEDVEKLKLHHDFFDELSSVRSISRDFSQAHMSSSVLSWVVDRLDSGNKVALAVVLRTSGSVPGKVGAKLALCEGQEGFVGTVGGAGLEFKSSNAVENSIEIPKPLTGKH